MTNPGMNMKAKLTLQWSVSLKGAAAEARAAGLAAREVAAMLGMTVVKTDRAAVPSMDLTDVRAALMVEME